MAAAQEDDDSPTAPLSLMVACGASCWLGVKWWRTGTIGGSMTSMTVGCPATTCNRY